jgi:hypothetical protein
MKKIVAICIGAAALSGCVSMKNAPVSIAALKPYQGQNLTIVTYKKSDFVAMTQSLALTSGLFGAVGGLVGGSIAADNGNKLVVDDAIPDPALDISTRLAPEVQAALQPSGVKSLADVDPKMVDEAALSKFVGSSGIVFDVQTVNWQFIYYPFSAHYRVTMAMRARLIDAKTGKRLAQAPCAYFPDEKDPPTYDEMLADHGVKLKAMLQAATETCFDTMHKALLSN